MHLTAIAEGVLLALKSLATLNVTAQTEKLQLFALTDNENQQNFCFFFLSYVVTVCFEWGGWKSMLKMSGTALESLWKKLQLMKLQESAWMITFS